MSKLISSIVIVTSLTGATAAMAAPHWTDFSKPCGGFSCDSQQGSRAFWEYQQEHGN